MLSRRVLKILLLSLLIAMGGVVFYFFMDSSGYRIDVGGVSFQGSDADLNVDKVHVVQNTKGVKEWELWADSAKVYREKDVTVLRNLRLRLYPKNGKPADVSARRGTMENKSRNMKISGNVIVRTAQGFSLQTESLYFRPQENRIDSDSRVRIEGKRFRLSGTGLAGRTDLGHYELKEKVRATLYDTREAREASR